MSNVKASEGTDVMVRPTMDQALEAFAPMLARIPDAEDDDGSGILLGILAAEDWTDVNTEGTMPDAESQLGKRLRIFRVTKRVSDIAESLPYYLVVDSTNVNTGEVVRWQTSSHTICAQLVKLHMLNRIPCIATVTKRDKPTKGGFFPLALNVLAAGQDL